jgi:SNF2-related domain/Helicase conserved C-terminal domain
MIRQLKPHQVRGRDWLLGGAGRALLWRMGGGKTGAALAALAEHRKVNPSGATWIVAPRLVADEVWPNESSKWPQFRLTLHRLRGGPAQRRQFLQAHANDSVILHYEQLTWAADEVRTGHVTAPTVLILDEASALHNPATRRWQAAVFVGARAAHRWLLTGSPFGTGGLVNAWGLVSVMALGEEWGRSFAVWRDRYFDGDLHGWRWQPKPETAQEVDRVLAIYGHALQAADYPDVPSKLVRMWIELPSRAREIYAVAKAELRGDLFDMQIAALSRAQPILGVLQQITGGAVYYQAGLPDWRHVHDAKLDQLAATLEETGPALVYAQYRHEVARLRQRWPTAPILAGGIPAHEVLQAVTAWNTGHCPLLIAHPAVASHGLNLQHGGSAVIWYSLPWSVEHFMQGNARLARPGQQNTVSIVLLLARDTIDMVIDRALQQRGRLEAGALQQLSEVR